MDRTGLRSPPTTQSPQKAGKTKKKKSSNKLKAINNSVDKGETRDSANLFRIETELLINVEQEAPQPPRCKKGKRDACTYKHQRKETLDGPKPPFTSSPNPATPARRQHEATVKRNTGSWAALLFSQQKLDSCPIKTRAPVGEPRVL